MARLIACPHCGAPHRAVASQNRFACDYCTGMVEFSVDIEHGEWVLGRQPELERAGIALGHELRARGVEDYRILSRQNRDLAFWYVLSDAGETHLIPASAEAPSFLKHVELPAAAALTRSAYEREHTPIDSALRIDEAEAEASALAAFRDRDASIQQVHLYWVPSMEMSFLAAGNRRRALAFGGDERILLEALPRRAMAPPQSHHALFAFGAYLLLLFALAQMISSPLLRAGILCLAYVAASLSWSKLLMQWARRT